MEGGTGGIELESVVVILDCDGWISACIGTSATLGRTGADPGGLLGVDCICETSVPDDACLLFKSPCGGLEEFG